MAQRIGFRSNTSISNLFHAVENKKETLETPINCTCGANIDATNKNATTAMSDAGKRRTDKAMEKLLDCGADINAMNKDGLTALSYAVMTEDEKALEKLVEHGADINATNKDGTTALSYAVMIQNEKLVEKLIESGADINAMNKNGRSALFYAVAKGNEKALEKLVECGADINAKNINGLTALSYAVMIQGKKAVENLIQCGADINATNKDGTTALFYAAKEVLVNKLIECGADINATNNNGSTPLFYAVARGNEKTIAKLVECGADFNATNKDGLTALSYAVKRGNEEVMEKLVKCGADVNAMNKDGTTALFSAVMTQNEKALEKLVEFGADINARNKDGTTTLSYAVMIQDEKVTEKLIQCGADINTTIKDGKTALFYAVLRGNEKMVETLIKCGADINAMDENGATPLFDAVHKENEKIGKKLIDCGADVNVIGKHGLTALFYAVRKENEKMVEKLIKHGADINAVNKYGETALFYAVQQSNNESLVHPLIGAGADVNITNNEGKTALFYAVQQSNNESLVHPLIEAGADVNISDNEGKTALSYAAMTGDEKVVEKLIKCGADINATNKDATTPLFYASKEVVVDKLIECGADINATNKNGSTSLFYAVARGNEKAIAKLVERGADFNATNKDGLTALSYAVMIQDKNVVEELVKCGADINAMNKDGTTALSSAVMTQDEKAVKILVNCGADMNATNKDGTTALFYAVLRGNERMMEKLVECGADINATNKNGLTALSYAVKRGNEKAVQKLVEYGADINATNKDGLTALPYAVMTGDEKTVEKLIKCGADINAANKYGQTALFYAVQQVSNVSVVRALIDAGAEVNITDNEGKTALFYAVQQRHNESVVCALNDGGADVNLTDNEGKTALFYAVQQSNNEHAVCALIDTGVDVNITDNEGKTALFFLNNFDESCDMAWMLIEDGGALVDPRDCYARTPVFYTMTQSLSLTRYLLDKGASLHLNENCSVLTYFIENCFFSLPGKISKLQDGLNLLTQCKEVEKNSILEAIVSVAFCKTLYFKPGSCDIEVECLSELMQLAKENVKVKNDVEECRAISEIYTFSHKKPYDKQLIESKAALELMGHFIKCGANPNTTDSDGNTALHHATLLALHDVTQESVMEICQHLKNLNVSLNITNHQNETPLLYCLTRTIKKLSREEEPWPAIKTQTAVCRFLVEDGSSVEAKIRSGETVLHLILKLLQQGLSKLNSKLRKDICDVALELIEVSINVLRQPKDSINTQDNSGNTPLHLWAMLQLAPGQDYSIAIAEKNAPIKKSYTFKKILKKILKLLGERKAHLNVKNENGETPLHLCRTWTAVGLLVKTGANRNEVDSSGRTPLLVATENNNCLLNPGQIYPDFLQQPKEFWKMAILEKGLDPWAVDKHGESVMSVLIEAESFGLAKGMIEFACEDNHLDSANSIVFSLLLAVCKDKTTSSHQKTILVEIILESRKCSVSGRDGEDSPLHLCCRNIVRNSYDVEDVHWTIAEKLLLYEANYTAPDSTGQSCLDIAEGCPKLRELLLKPIDIDKVPKRMEWKSMSVVHKDKLAKTARKRKSIHVESYWYHKDYLATGSFGSVFAGINEKDGREVAIKRIEKIRMQRPQDKREIINLTALADCEQVVCYLFFFEDEHFSYIVLELMEGNLSQFLNKAIIRMDTKVSLCQDIVKGLKFLHNQSILHRDLKPTNILYKIHPKLCLKIADFGLSSSMDSTGSSISVYGSDVGTRCWIAPEVLNSTKPHSKSSDVFACGLVLHYFLADRRHPFAPATCGKKRMLDVTETENNIIAENMEGWDASLCPEAAHLLESMLDGDKSKRPPADKVLDHPFFWPKKKKQDFLTAVGNQPEFECPRARRTLPLTAVETDLETSFGTIVKYVDWNDPRYVHMPAIYTEMTRRRRYDTRSVVELVRFIRNALAHVSESVRPIPIRKQLLEDFVFLEYFPDLVMEVHEAVSTHGWDQTREEIKYVLQ